MKRHMSWALLAGAIALGAAAATAAATSGSETVKGIERGVR